MGGFTLLFLGEYSGFFWILGLFSFIFRAGFFLGSFLFLFLVTIRAVLPRLKFVQVVKLSWGVLNLFIFIYFFGLFKLVFPSPPPLPFFSFFLLSAHFSK